jgi:hypothetical protein
MSDEHGFMAAAGISASKLFSGMAGGLVGAWADEKVGFRIWAAYVVCGGLVANYLGESARHAMPSWVDPLAIGFILGACAPAVIKGLREVVKRWKPQIGAG